MNPGEDPAAVADERKLPLAHRLDRVVVTGAVEDAVAQRDPAKVGDGALEMLERREALLQVLRGAPQRVVLGLDGAALPCVPAIAGAALRDEPAYPDLARGRQKRIGAFRPDLVGLGERLVEVAAELHVRKRGCLMHDRLGPALEHGLAHRARVEQVKHQRLRAERPQQRRLCRRVVGADDLMARIDQLGNESAADRAAPPSDEYTHRYLPSLSGHRRG
jgi:hypothetical protein